MRLISFGGGYSEWNTRIAGIFVVSIKQEIIKEDIFKKKINYRKY